MGSPMIVVVGGGLSGLSAAIHLAERGLPVTLCEAHPRYLGGRTRGRDAYSFSWDGREHVHSLDHGQHCVWFQYWNMRHLLARLGLFEASMRPCETTCYVIDDGERVHRPTPFDVSPERIPPSLLHFLVHLAEATRSPALRKRDAVKLLLATPQLLTAFSFDHTRDYEDWDHLSIAEFFAWVGLPEASAAVFKSLCKASTFHPHTEISASWGLSMMESTMLGHPSDHKMWCFRGNLGTHLMDPLAAHFRALGGTILKNASAVGLDLEEGRVTAVRLEPTVGAPDPRDGEALRAPMRLACDALVSAVDIPGFRRLMLPELSHHDEIRTAANLETVGNVTLRVVTSRRLGPREPWLGLFSGRFHFLDAYFLVSRYQDEFVAWSARTGGEVIELHSYLAQTEIEASSPDFVRREVTRELVRAWPELAGSVVHVEYFANERTFDKQTVGRSRCQPSMRTSVPNLLLAGSWIKVDTAIHDMEKAVVTGMRAANALLEERGLAAFEVKSLRPKGPTHRLVSALSSALPRPPAVRRSNGGATPSRV
jgi:isorenieratene synthase